MALAAEVDESLLYKSTLSSTSNKNKKNVLDKLQELSLQDILLAQTRDLEQKEIVQKKKERIWRDMGFLIESTVEGEAY